MIADVERVRAPRRAWPLRAPPVIIGLLALAAFAVDTALALRQPHLPFDVPVTRALQAVPWGPLVAAFAAVDWLEGIRQVIVAVAGIVLVLLLHRRAAPLALVAAMSGIAYSATEQLIARPRPPAGLVHVVRHTNGFSYPSGHAVFFSCFVPILLLALVRPRLPAAFTWLSLLLSVALAALAGVGRVVVGEHWPSDVLGGLALGVGWAALALSVRWLSDPVLQRRPGTRRRGPARLWG
ncbi:MAG TPA: phosphatase PAP2 family protein [Candidatus Dormibacteraeota bacterium]